MNALEYNQRRGYSREQIKQIQHVVSEYGDDGALALDGIWGPKTVEAVAKWQRATSQLKPDGKVGPKTWQAMLSLSGRVTSELDPEEPLRPRHPLPESTWKWNYEHAPMVWHRPDPQWKHATGDDSFEARLLRLVTGWDPAKKTFSRGPDSCISLDTYSLGVAHWWADTAPPVLAEIARKLPTLACWAWGKQAAEAMRDPRWLKRRHAPRRGKMALQPGLHWLLAGWYEIARHPDVIAIQCRQWLDSYSGTPLAIMRERRWRYEWTLAALIRCCNSRGGDGLRGLLRRAEAECGSRDEVTVVGCLYQHHELYDHPERLEDISALFVTRDAPVEVALHRSIDKRIGLAAVQRHDGSTPRWLEEGVCE